MAKVVRCLLLVREVWGSNHEPVKSPTDLHVANNSRHPKGSEYNKDLIFFLFNLSLS